jgi:hypothetical protein
MESEIMALFLDYCNKKKFIDTYFINQVFLIITKYIDTNGYLKNVIVNNKDKRNGSFYNTIDQVISFNLKLEHDKFFMKKLDYDDYVYWYNLFVLRTIFHEFKHVKQEEHKFEYKFDIEQKLIVLNDLRTKLSLDTLKDRIKSFIVSYKYHHYYMKHHDLSPSERMANIHASKRINAFCDQLEIENEGIRTFRIFEEFEMLNEIRSGYHLVNSLTNSPSIDFIKGIHDKVKDQVINIDKMLSDMSLSFDKRLYYGLYLTSDEYQMIQDDNYLKEFVKRV